MDLLAKLTHTNIELDPFPHVIIRNAVDTTLAKALMDEYPPLNILTDNHELESNCRFHYPLRKSLTDSSVSPLWRAFLTQNSTTAFFAALIGAFGDSITSLYPQRFPAQRCLEALRVGRRGIDNFPENDILLDTGIAGNTPVVTPSSVRATHVDLPSKLFSGLWYLRAPHDDSRGGELELHSPVSTAFEFYDGVYVDSKYSRCVKRVPYENNTLIVFLNSPLSWHGVTVRQRTPFPRLFVNFVAEFETELFDLSAYQPPGEQSLLQGRLKTLYSN